MRQPLKANPWRDVHAEPAVVRRVITADDVAAAYQQGRRDFDAGHSSSKARHADHGRDAAWQRGYFDALRQKRGGTP